MKKKGYGNIKTQSASDLEYIKNDKEYYFSWMEYIFITTNLEDFNAHLLGCAPNFF